MRIRATSFIFCISSLSGAYRQVATESRVQSVFFGDGSPVIANTTFLDSLPLFISEADEEALISNTDRVCEFDRRYFILDKRMRQVLCHTLFEKHLLTMHTVGSGEGKYVDLSDIAIDKTENKLLLLVRPSQVLYCGLGGTYLSSYPLDNMHSSSAMDSGRIYLRDDAYVNGAVSDHSLTVVNKETGKRTSLLEPLHETAPFCSFGNYQVTNITSVLFTRKFDNYIYRITGESIESLYMIDWESESFPENNK